VLASSIPPVSLGTGSTVRMYAFHGSELLVRVEGIHVTPATGQDIVRLNLPELQRCQLQQYCSVKGTAVALGQCPSLPEGYELRPLRSLYGALDEKLTGEAGAASQVLTWDRNSRFCGACGGAMQPKADEHAKKCASCGAVAFPRVSPATITAVISGKRILLAHNRRFATGVYSLVAGFVEAGESLETCVRREVQEEVGVTVTDIAYFGSQSWPFPDTLMVGFTAAYHAGEIKPDGAEIDDAQWFDAHHLPKLPGHGSISRRIIDYFAAKYA